jgi:hypothetical protein
MLTTVPEKKEEIPLKIVGQSRMESITVNNFSICGGCDIPQLQKGVL